MSLLCQNLLCNMRKTSCNKLIHVHACALEVSCTFVVKYSAYDGNYMYVPVYLLLPCMAYLAQHLCSIIMLTMLVHVHVYVCLIFTLIFRS